MKRYKIVLPVFAGIVSTITIHAEVLTVTPGNLASVLKSSNNITGLKGEIDASDYKAFSSMPGGISKLDLSALNFQGGYGQTEDGRIKLYAKGELPEYIFFQSAIEEVTLPSNLKSIGEGAFAGSSLKNITIPSGCTRIDAFAFYECDKLTNVNSEAKQLTIEDLAFAGCDNLTSANFKGSTHFVGKEIFKDTQITRLDLSKGSSYGEYSISGNGNLTSVSLNPQADKGTGMLMSNSSLTTIKGLGNEIPAAFAVGSPNVSLSLEEGIEEIGEFAFAGNATDLIVLMPGIEFIDTNAFANMNKLTGVDATYLGNVIPEAEEDAFGSLDLSLIKLFIKEDSYNNWAAHPFWSKFDLKPGESKVEFLEEDPAASIKIRFDKNIIRFEDPEGVGEFSLYGLDGIKLLSGNSSDNIVICPIPENAPKIIVARVVNEHGQKSLTVAR